MVKNIFSIGIAVILLVIAAVIYVKSQNGVAPVSEVDSETLTSVENGIPRFEFYTLLPESSVPISDENEYQSGYEQDIQNDDEGASSDVSVSFKQYILQIASLSHREEAEKLKQQLFSHGFDVYIEEFDHENILWYRVRWGPFPSLQAAEHALDELNVYNFNAMLQRIH